MRISERAQARASADRDAVDFHQQAASLIALK
jgi:hypothetical protein